MVDAKQDPHDRAKALALLAGMKRLVATRGRKVIEIDLTQQPGEATLLELLLGPTGKLRAPTARVGTTLLVGFDPEMYRTHLGK